MVTLTSKLTSNNLSNQGVRGSLGAQSGYGALQALEVMQASGTLLLGPPRGEPGYNTHFWLGLFSRGQSKPFTLGEALELSTLNLDFTFYPHRASDPSAEPLPQLGSRFSESSVAALCALPALGGERLNAHDTDLRSLVTRLSFEDFTGTLTVLAEAQQGLMLFSNGRIGAAFYEVESKTEGALQGNSALRTMLQLTDQHFAQARQSLKEGEGCWLELCTLPSLITASLLGLAQEQPRQVEESEPRKGIEVSSAGYTYLNAGRPYLFVAANVTKKRGFYSAIYSSEALSLPSEPPGWEEQRYHLTLRGRDALNPMTELAMRFEREFGRTGRQTLTQLARRSTVADAARSLSLEPNDLRPHVERLEAESLIRKAER